MFSISFYLLAKFHFSTRTRVRIRRIRFWIRSFALFICFYLNRSFQFFCFLVHKTVTKGKPRKRKEKQKLCFCITKCRNTGIKSYDASISVPKNNKKEANF